ncbi:MAG: DEAD/DEAH box helicase [Candidatus Omnitrophica bacterium]|nr:DEAD/DEAH box helicase [Candidatus Omnitrophota bacterium]
MVGMIYDPFQEKAINYIKEGYSVIVSAPTGAGKTVIAEHVINDCLAKGTKAIYTAPIKALSNQKFRDFQENFKDHIGILTGDVTINPAASILIMTTEIFRNKVLEEETNLNEYSWIIFDEIHYLDDYERGTVWEESLIFLPPRMKMLALSATIPNIDEFARWIESIHKKPLKVIKEDKRPVPLHFFFQCHNKILDNTIAIKNIGRHEQFKPNKPVGLIKYLFENNKLPCIYFCFSRRHCERLAEEIMCFDFLNYDEKQAIKTLYRELRQRFDLLNEKSAEAMLPFVEKGIAFHHAGMMPTLKEVVERLFTSRLIKVIFTTETFALGINMPARTVVFNELRKFYGNFYSALKTRDFYQMAGRAGRRGIDEEGFVYSRINPHHTSGQELNKIIYGTPEKVESKFNASYATILNLYSKYKEKLYEIYPLSFHYFQANKHSRQKALDLLYNKVRLLKDLGYIKNNSLTKKGEFASKIYGYELSLAELYERGILENLSETELGILCLGLVFEPRKTSILPKLSKTAKSIKNITDTVLEIIEKSERKMRIRPFSKRYYYHLSPCLEAWVRNESFDNILRHTDSDEGEIIRYFRMGVQILRELMDTPCSPEFKEKALKLIRIINRDIIDAEKQLRG